MISRRANNALYVHALEARAQRLGLYKGQPLANAQAMVRELTVLPADEKADAALLEHIADWCDRFSPFVACDAPDGLMLDITGAAHLFGGEAAMLNLVSRKIAAQGFAVRGRHRRHRAGGPGAGAIRRRPYRGAGHGSGSAGAPAGGGAGLAMTRSAAPWTAPASRPSPRWRRASAANWRRVSAKPLSPGWKCCWASRTSRSTRAGPCPT